MVHDEGVRMVHDEGVRKPASRTMDGNTLLLNLRPSGKPDDVSAASLSKDLQYIADEARRRVTFNNCGGLPGPPPESPSFIRRLLNLFTSDADPAV